MTLHGKLIEYLDAGKFICALVQEDTGKRLRIVTQSGREEKLPLARVVHQGKKAYPSPISREEAVRLLKKADETRKGLIDSVNLEEIWELVIGESGNVFTSSFLAELSFGKDLTDDHEAAFIRSVFADTLFFKYKQGAIVAHSAEMVEQLRLRREKERAQETLLSEGARGLKALWDGSPQDDWPERECLELVRDYYLFDSAAPESALARELLKRADLTGQHAPFHLLVKAGIWNQDENIPLLRQDIPIDFPAEVLAQAEAIPQPTPEDLLGQRRRDLRHLDLLTIDGPSTRDFDDALHIEKRDNAFLVGIHIADVASLIRPGSPLFAEALRRGTSIYFADRQIPMLPPVLSEGICSLHQGEIRPALSFMVLLSNGGEVLDFDVMRSVVTVKRQLLYSEADRLVASDQSLSALHTLAGNLRKRRLEADALLLPFPDVNIAIKGENDIEITLSESDTPGRLLVAEFMILANTLGAQYVSEREAAGLYRSQAKPRQRLVRGEDKSLFANTLQRKKLAPMSLTTTAKPHSGLGVPQYTTLTSPIRRLLDLIMQLQLENLAAGKGLLFTKKDMKEFAPIILQTLNRVNGVKFLRHRYWIYRYFESRKGERFPALVIEKGPQRAHLLLTNCLLDADMATSQLGNTPAGATIMVRITKVSALDNVLQIEPAP